MSSTTPNTGSKGETGLPSSRSRPEPPHQAYRNLVWKAPQPSKPVPLVTSKVNGLHTPVEPSFSNQLADYSNAPITNMSAMDLDRPPNPPPPPIDTGGVTKSTEGASAAGNSNQASKQAPSTPTSAAGGGLQAAASEADEVQDAAWFAKLNDEKDLALFAVMILHNKKTEVVKKRDLAKANLSRFGSLFDAAATSESSTEIQQLEQTIEHLDKSIESQKDIRATLSRKLSEAMYGVAQRARSDIVPQPVQPSASEGTGRGDSGLLELRRRVEKLEDRVLRYRNDTEDHYDDFKKVKKRLADLEDDFDRASDDAVSRRSPGWNASKGTSEHPKDLEKRLDAVESSLKDAQKAQDERLQKGINEAKVNAKEEASKLKQEAIDASLKQLEARLKSFNLAEKDTLDKMSENSNQQFREIGQKLEPLLKQIADLETKQLELNQKQVGMSQWGPGSGDNDPNQILKEKGVSMESLNSLLTRINAQDIWLKNLSSRMDATTGRDQALRLLEVLKEQVPDLSSLLKDIYELQQKASKASSELREMREDLNRRLAEEQNHTKRLHEIQQQIDDLKASTRSDSGIEKEAHQLSLDELHKQLEDLTKECRQNRKEMEDLKKEYKQNRKEMEEFAKHQKDLEEFMLNGLAEVKGALQAIEESVPADRIKALIAYVDEQREGVLSRRQSDADSRDEMQEDTIVALRSSPRKPRAQDMGKSIFSKSNTNTQAKKRRRMTDSSP